MEKPEKMILTAGPSITQKEIDYVNDAVQNGWNFHLDDYVVSFEKTLANYVQQGIVSMEEALSFAIRPEELTRLLKGGGSK